MLSDDVTPSFPIIGIFIWEKIPDFYLKIATSNAYNLPPTSATFKRKTVLESIH